jgi:hypothetical protein
VCSTEIPCEECAPCHCLGGPLKSAQAFNGVTRFAKESLQSRSATASLLIKIDKFIEEKTKLFIVLAQESKHIMSSCLGTQRCILPAVRNHVGIDAMDKNMLLILDIISITQVTGEGVTLIPCRCLKT